MALYAQKKALNKGRCLWEQTANSGKRIRDRVSFPFYYHGGDDDNDVEEHKSI